MNYSTMPPEMPQAPADEPLLNREVRLNIKTILGAAAFVSFVIGSLAVVALAPALSAEQGHCILQSPRLERRRDMQQEDVRPRLHEQRQLSVEALPALS